MRLSLIISIFTLIAVLTITGGDCSEKKFVPWNLKELYLAPAWQETSVVKPLGDQAWDYSGDLTTPELKARDRVNGNVKAILYDGAE